MRQKCCTHFIVAAVLIVVAAILGGAFLAVDLAGVQSQIPNFRVMLHLQSLVGG